jgi:hypothetical protein
VIKGERVQRVFSNVIKGGYKEELLFPPARGDAFPLAPFPLFALK